MAWQNVPRKLYRLHDGSKGTKYEALTEVIKHKETQLRQLEDELEELKHKRNLAEGAPHP